MANGSKRYDSKALCSKLVLELASENEGVVSVKECVCAELGVADFLTADSGSDTHRSYFAFRNTFSNLIVKGKAVQHNGYTTQIRILLELS